MICSLIFTGRFGSAGHKPYLFNRMNEAASQDRGRGCRQHSAGQHVSTLWMQRMEENLAMLGGFNQPGHLHIVTSGWRGDTLVDQPQVLQRLPDWTEVLLACLIDIVNRPLGSTVLAVVHIRCE